MGLGIQLLLLHGAETALADSARIIAAGHGGDFDVHYACLGFARRSDERRSALTPVTQRYPATPESAADERYPQALETIRGGPIGLLRDLQDLYQLVGLVGLCWELTGQAAHAARDVALIDLATDCTAQTAVAQSWLRMRMRSEAPQALLAGP